jgi:hypothetical protein
MTPRRRPRKKKRSRNKLRTEETRRRKSKKSSILLSTLRTARTLSRPREMLAKTLTRTNFQGLIELTTSESLLKLEESKAEFLSRKRLSH